MSRPGSALGRWLSAQARAREDAGLTRALRPRPPHADAVDLAGNDYLGLATDPRVSAAAAEAARVWGAGAGASRLVTGTLDLHVDLERALAGFCGQAAALLFSTGYHANLGAVTALSDDDTLIVSDAHVHASLVDACRLARGRVHVVPHGDLGAVAAALSERAESRALVLCESVYSVLGDAAPLAALVRLCRRHDATLVVDEAHALGVVGPRGAGSVASLGLADDEHVVVTLTLSKSLGSQGGAVLGSAPLVEHLVNRSRPFIFDTGLAPAAAGGALEALRIVAAEPELPARARDCAAALADAVEVDVPAGAVLSVPMPGPREALAAQQELADHGLRVGCFRPPSVPDQVSRLRLTASARLGAPELDEVAAVLTKVVVG
ncbi:MAG: 8-amino-7-oxononanoate synthase [Actinomycetota bacterium]|nr:8-amino-7-oxononanoate synthase [Actinomycetota bacterium]